MSDEDERNLSEEEEESSVKNNLEDDDEESELREGDKEEKNSRDEQYHNSKNGLSEDNEDEDEDAKKSSGKSEEIAMDKKELYKEEEEDRDTYSMHDKSENQKKKRGRKNLDNFNKKRKKLKKESDKYDENSENELQNQDDQMQSENDRQDDYQNDEFDEDLKDKPTLKLLNDLTTSRKGKKNKKGEPEDSHSTGKISLEELYEKKTKTLIEKLHSAFEEDLEALKQGKPAIKRLKMIKEAHKDLNSVLEKYYGFCQAHNFYNLQYEFQREFIKQDGLNVFPRWLAKLPDGTQPSNEMKSRVLETLLILKLESSHIKSSSIGRSIGQIVKNNEENFEVKKLAKKVMEDWSRILLDQRISYKMEDDMAKDELRNQNRESRASNQIKKPNEIDGISGQELNRQSRPEGIKCSFYRSAVSKQEKSLNAKPSDSQKDFIRILNNMTHKKKK